MFDRIRHGIHNRQNVGVQSRGEHGLFNRETVSAGVISVQNGVQVLNQAQHVGAQVGNQVLFIQSRFDFAAQFVGAAFDMTDLFRMGHKVFGHAVFKEDMNRLFVNQARFGNAVQKFVDFVFQRAAAVKH